MDDSRQRRLSSRRVILPCEVMVSIIQMYFLSRSVRIFCKFSYNMSVGQFYWANICLRGVFLLCILCFLLNIGNMNVVVYCSSASGLDGEYVEAARKVGAWIGEHSGRLVYGGVDAGLMHEVAAAVKLSGGSVCGVVPEVFIGRADALCDEVIGVENLSVRKGKMIELGDIFVVLPGGVGTIDEWISTLSHFMVVSRADASQVCRLVVLNAGGMYDDMIAQLLTTGQSVFGAGRRSDMSVIVADCDGLTACLDDFAGELVR